jgi:hypothetical protein
MKGSTPRSARRYAMTLVAATAAVTMAVSAVPASAAPVHTAPVQSAQRHLKREPLLTWAQAERYIAAHPQQDIYWALCLWNDDNYCVEIRSDVGAEPDDVGEWVAVVIAAASLGYQIWRDRQAAKDSDQDENEGDSNGDENYVGWCLGAPGHGNVGVMSCGDGSYWQAQPNPKGGDYLWNTNQRDWLTVAGPTTGDGLKLTGKGGWYTWGYRPYEG